MLAEQSLGIPFTLFLYAQGRIEGALRVILMGDGSAEQRKDAVTQRLGDVALVMMHGFHHQREHRIDEAAGFLGIEVFDERGGVFDISKERGDSLAFPVCGAARL